MLDANYQYSLQVAAGSPEGPMYPKYRKVWKEGIALLRTNLKLSSADLLFIGDISNVWYESQEMFNL